LLLILPLSLTACASLTSFRATERAPQTHAARVARIAFEPIRLSKADTDKTMAPIQAHKTAWVALCR